MDTDTARAHQHRLVQTRHVLAQIHGTGMMGRFNTWLAVWVTKTVGTMWMAYAFALLTLVSLPAAIASRNTIVIISWIAQTFLQLVLLPIIIVGQNVIQAANDKRAEADHETLLAIHQLTTATNSVQGTQLEILNFLRAHTHA